jgi:hypothetical protein
VDLVEDVVERNKKGLQVGLNCKGFERHREMKAKGIGVWKEAGYRHTLIGLFELVTDLLVMRECRRYMGVVTKEYSRTSRPSARDSSLKCPRCSKSHAMAFAFF